MMNLSSLSKAKIATFTAIVTAAASTLVGFAGMQTISLFLLIGTLVALASVLYFQSRTEKEITRTKNACQALAKGDFEVRLVNITEGGDFGEFQWALNEVVDYVDAFVREATAAMEYVSRNLYFRRILEDGMQGSLLNGARVINSATVSVGEKMNGFIVPRQHL